MPEQDSNHDNTSKSMSLEQLHGAKLVYELSDGTERVVEFDD